MKKQIVRLAVGSALAIAFTMSAARVTLGDVADDCHRKLEADRARIDHDAAKHGNDSRQVARDVDRMDADRNWCREHHADWDHSRFDVGIYIKH
ncbi:MAG TPA: hypothetical protein VMD77_05515 [Candidatus Baltobacteraceae bacterium]|jgi:hypothetical protein|nr:hypothetical protein [Candidatus Baltobacteraceae bacterium]